MAAARAEKQFGGEWSILQLCNLKLIETIYSWVVRQATYLVWLDPIAQDQQHPCNSTAAFQNF